jgi:protein O-GlcNAc transferase
MMPLHIERTFHTAVGLHRAGDHARAEGLYRELIGEAPRHHQALYLLALIELEAGRNVAAALLLERAISEDPDQPAYQANLGEALRRAGDLPRAKHALRRALALKPELAQGHYNLGLVLESTEDWAAAASSYERAVELAPALSEAWFRLGQLHWKAARIDHALATFRRGVEHCPDDADLRHGLAVALKDVAELDEAIAHYGVALGKKPDYQASHSNLVYLLSFHPEYSDQDIAGEARRWSEAFELPHVAARRPHDNHRDGARRLRVGYVGPTFRDHIIGRLMVPVLEHHDLAEVEIYCYSDAVDPDAITERLRGASQVFRETAGLADGDLAALVRDDSIDVLVDVNMHMADSRLGAFARKPAPVQVCWLAYPGTSGLTAMDYRLSDPHLDPPGGDESCYSERTVRLPHGFWCFDPLSAAAPPVGPLPALGRRRLTFGCLSNFCKISPGTLALWSRVLLAVPDSELVLLVQAQEARRAVLRTLGEHGVAAQRVRFESYKPRERYLENYRQIDIGLDSFPYNGHTTSIDSLWMGVPVVTMRGHTVAGRAGVCLAENVGLPELVARDATDFVRIAVELATDLQQLAALRASLRARLQASPLMDAAGFTRGLEAAYRSMWRAWCG